MTGGLGFVGSRLCAALAERGYGVVCVDRLGAEYSAGAGPDAALALAGRARVLRADLADVDLGELLDPVDAVIHLAALPGVRTPHSVARLWAENVEATRRLMAAAGAGGKRLVLASSSSVYGNASDRPTPEDAPLEPLSPYAASKLAAEEVCRAAVARRGADVVLTRLFTVFGPGQRPDMAFTRWIDALAEDRPLPWTAAPGSARELTYVDDAARGLIAALEHGRAGETYNVGGCGSHDLERVLALLAQEVGRPARVARSAPSCAEAVRTHACRRKSERELGYRPAVSLEEGLREQVRAAAAAPVVAA